MPTFKRTLVLSILAVSASLPTASQACLDKTPDYAKPGTAIFEKYTRIQEMMRLIQKTQSQTVRASLVSGLAELLPDDSAYVSGSQSCSTQTMLLIRNLLVAPSGKIWVGSSTATLVQALSKSSLFIPYDLKYSILTRIMQLTPAQAEPDDSFGELTPAQKAQVLPQFLRETLEATAPLFEISSFAINIPAYFDFVRMQIARQPQGVLLHSFYKGSEIYLMNGSYPVSTIAAKQAGKQIYSLLMQRTLQLMQVPSSSIYNFLCVQTALDLLGKYATAYEAKAQFAALTHEIESRKGEFPVSTGIYEGAKSLLISSERAQAYLHH